MRVATALFVALTALAVSAAAAPPPYRAPAESLTLKPSPGVEVVVSRCAVCHSLDYIATQPPRTASPAFWQAEVTKMVKTFGAPIEEADRQTIVAYLNTAYGSAARPGP